LTVRLTAAVIATLLLIGSPFLLAFHTLRRAQQLEALTAATSGMSLVVVDSLRSAMLAGEPHLLDDVMRRIANQEQVDRVMLLDHRSELRLSSRETGEGQILHRETDPTCAVCHQPGAESPASRTVVARSRGRRVLRSMTTIRNEPECHGCHNSANPINGVLLMDFALVETDHRFFGDIGRTLILGAIMVVVTVAVLVWLLRRMVHRPLEAVVSASQRIVGGDLDAQAIVPQAGEFAELASQVNRMTAHLSHSIRTVETQRGELQTILDAIDDEVLVIDSGRRVVTANQAFRSGFGRSDIEPMGWGCCKATIAGAIGADVSGRECPVKRVFETGRLQKGIMSQMQSDGQERVIEIHASPLLGADGVVDRVVEVRRDISERRQMEAVVANSERLASLGLLASGLSHEINNPLGAIAATVEGLRRRLPDEPGISSDSIDSLGHVLSQISLEVQRCRTITHRLLEVARPPSGTRGLADLNHIVKNILAVLSHDIKKYGIAARLELGRLPPLRLDEARLGQVVMNLTLNAIQSMSAEGGELRIATAAMEDEIRIEFEDTGCGIPASLLKRVFEPFFTTKPVGKGTGLGLFITHRIVSNWNGNIEVKSELDRGTIITLRLPVDDRQSAR
jgi:signal transduction histidine kinase